MPSMTVPPEIISDAPSISVRALKRSPSQPNTSIAGMLHRKASE